MRIVLGMHSRFVDVGGAKSISGGIAVVGDAMRPDAVAAWARAAGATGIVLVDDIVEAVTIAARTPSDASGYRDRPCGLKVSFPQRHRIGGHQG